MAVWNFFGNIRSNIVKWWRLVVLPVFHLDNNNPQMFSQQVKENTQIRQEDAVADTVKKEGNTEKKAVHKNTAKDNSDTWWGEAMQNQTEGDKDELFSTKKYTAGTDNKDALEILNRLEREKQEAIIQKQKEIEETRRKAQEQERINSILDANKVDVGEFIEEGKRKEDLQKAQEIIDRLNREALEDEAKKAAEIEEAKAKAAKEFNQQ
ncbi:MAG: hypothetical protein K2L07_15230 [Lachnospiraceae bacterium]|nr:hypothetical protein [Lachnospiraceae bacterium]